MRSIAGVMPAAFKQRLSSPRAGAFIVVCALLLASSSLNTGLVADDYFHKLVLTGSGDIHAIGTDPLDLFVWASGEADIARAYMDVGMTGWWTDPDLVLAYWRPVTVFTHWIDYRLWPESPFLMHLHSLLWFGLSLVVLVHLYRRLAAPENSGWMAALALLMFAWDDAHGLTISWIANRNALVALFFAAAALLLHDRARRDGHIPSAWLGPVVLAVALQAGEIALAICAYLFAYALFLDPAGRGKGMVRILPHALVALVWSVFYYIKGYGAHGSGLVVDPVRDPGHYLIAVAERLPVLLLAQTAIPPSDLWEYYPAVGKWLPVLMLTWAISVLLALAFFLRPLVARDRTARFWLCSTVLSGLPACAQFPHDRLLLFIGVGAMALLARFIGAFLEGETWLLQAPGLDTPAGRRALTVFAGALIFFHLAAAPLLLPLRARGPADISRMLRLADATIDSGPGVRDRTVILMNPPADAFAGYIPTMRAATGRHRPKYMRWLATGACQVEVERVDTHTLRVAPADGFLSLASEHMQRSLRNAIPAGHIVSLTDLRITVTRLTSDGRRPAEIIARFSHRLEDERYIFLYWTEKGFRPFELPRVGERVTLKAADFISLLR